MKNITIVLIEIISIATHRSNSQNHELILECGRIIHDKWVPVTKAWRALRLRKEKRPPISRVAANILNKQLRTTDEGWSSRLGVVRGANNCSTYKLALLRNAYIYLEPGLILCFDISNGKGT